MKDRAQAFDARRHRKTVSGDRVAEQGSDRSVLFGGKIRLHSGWNMRRKGFEGESGPATLGSTARAHLLLRVWCNACRRIVDLDPGEQAERHGADLDLLVWRERLVCAQCGSRQVDFVVAPRRTGGLDRD